MKSYIATNRETILTYTKALGIFLTIVIANALVYFLS